MNDRNASDTSRNQAFVVRTTFALPTGRNGGGRTFENHHLVFAPTEAEAIGYAAGEYVIDGRPAEARHTVCTPDELMARGASVIVPIEGLL